ncbi:MAG: AAA family ATPase [Phenylobacterium sp.]|uniref:nucleotide-binding protein n=1 Tax=Phenylobacterium sp. TaxID=1871053 RepID=UPI00391B9890
MKTIAVISRKGGAGKTTLAVNLFAALRQAERRTVLADADPLRSTSEALRATPGDGGPVVETSASKLFALTTASARSGVERLVIDTPASPEADIVAAIKLADLCLIVARPTYLDLSAALKTLELVRQLSTRGMVVLNQCPPARRGAEPRSVAATLETLRFSGVPVAPRALRARLAYQNAIARGQGVVDYEPEGVAAAEVRSLAAAVEQQFVAEAAPAAANDAAAPRRARS